MVAHEKRNSAQLFCAVPTRNDLAFSSLLFSAHPTQKLGYPPWRIFQLLCGQLRSYTKLWYSRPPLIISCENASGSDCERMSSQSQYSESTDSSQTGNHFFQCHLNLDSSHPSRSGLAAEVFVNCYVGLNIYPTQNFEGYEGCSKVFCGIGDV